jgi:HSP20 family protein
MQEFGTGSAQQVSEQTQQRLTGTPSIDIVDTPDELVLFVDLPGYEEENIKIQADGQNLSVSAERRDEDQEEGREYTRERPQKLHRTVRLPTRANVNEADASYENGVCKITLPKMEEDRQHEIAFQ